MTLQSISKHETATLNVLLSINEELKNLSSTVRVLETKFDLLLAGKLSLPEKNDTEKISTSARLLIKVSLFAAGISAGVAGIVSVIMRM